MKLDYDDEMENIWLRQENAAFRRMIAKTHKTMVKHENCRDDYCPVCIGGLFICADCGLAEIELEEQICTGRMEDSE